MKTARFTQNRTARYVALALAISVLPLSACAPSSVPSELQGLQGVLASCSPDVAEASSVRQDVSGSRRANSLAGSDRQAVIDSLIRTAVCGGQFRLDLFSSSSASAVTVVEKDLSVPGQTDTARLRKVPDLITSVLSEIDGAYPLALSQVTDGKTDVLAQLSAGKDYVQQLTAQPRTDGKTYKLRLTVLTDGIATTGVAITNLDLTIAQADELTKTVPVPKLSDAQINFVGIGQSLDQPGFDRPTTEFVDALKTFYQAVLQRTDAQKVSVVTEYTSGNPLSKKDR